MFGEILAQPVEGQRFVGVERGLAAGPGDEVAAQRIWPLRRARVLKSGRGCYINNMPKM
jgi:hypothetical protein